jgi:hypothetical protein
MAREKVVEMAEDSEPVVVELISNYSSTRSIETKQDQPKSSEFIFF